MSHVSYADKPAKGSAKKGRAGRIVFRVLLCLFTFLIIVGCGAYSALQLVHFGPSESARNLFTASVMETSAAKFLATWFLPSDVISKILGEDEGEVYIPPIKVDAIQIWKPTQPGEQGSEGTNQNQDAPPFDIDAIEIIEIMGRTFTGKMMIINDPTRLSVGYPSSGFGEGRAGVTTLNMVKNADALAGVNGGGFEDYDGKGNGGVPMGRRESGIVISGGKLLWGSLNRKYEVIGISEEGVLVLGTMTAQDALDMGVVEALNYGPYLVLDGEPHSVVGESFSGLNPRTAIGQRQDGAILLLVINGRQSNSLGATLQDLVELMIEYGAVNAANLDGGSSSYMVYENEIITTCASLYGPRRVSTSILVSRLEE